MSRLMAAYWEAMLEEPLELPRFMERVAAERYGHFTADEIVDFLEDAERDILANIELRAGVNPTLGGIADERREETRLMIADLIKKYAGR